MKPPTTEQRLLFERATKQYQEDLAADAAAQQYLLGRGFTQQAAQAARYGVVRRPVTGHEQYEGRLALPYQTPSGVINMRFRCLQQHDCKEAGCPKYLSLEGMETNLYGVADLKRVSPFICVTEGEIDRDTLSLLCGLPAVGVPGVENWQDHFRLCLEDFDRVYSFADPDKAGRKFASFLAREVRAIPIRLPDDVNATYMKEGADGIRKLIAG